MEQPRKEQVRRVSGRNQLVGRMDSVQISGLMAEVRISIGGQQTTFYSAPGPWYPVPVF